LLRDEARGGRAIGDGDTSNAGQGAGGSGAGGSADAGGSGGGGDAGDGRGAAGHDGADAGNPGGSGVGDLGDKASGGAEAGGGAAPPAPRAATSTPGVGDTRGPGAGREPEPALVVFPGRNAAAQHDVAKAIQIAEAALADAEQAVRRRRLEEAYVLAAGAREAVVPHAEASPECKSLMDRALKMLRDLGKRIDRSDTRPPLQPVTIFE